MKLYIVENALFHRCCTPGSSGNRLYHANYEKKNAEYFCPKCNIRIPTILNLLFKIIEESYKNTLLLIDIRKYFIGSKKAFSSLKNRDYKVLELK